MGGKLFLPSLFIQSSEGKQSPDFNIKICGNKQDNIYLCKIIDVFTVGLVNRVVSLRNVFMIAEILNVKLATKQMEQEVA